MKILMISNTFLPVLNGISTRVNELIKGMPCDVFTMSPHPRASCDKFLYNMKLFDDVYISSVWPIGVLTNVYNVVNICIKENIDIVHIFGPDSSIYLSPVFGFRTDY